MITCLAPLPFETLVALWSDELDPEAADAGEEHLFSCEACAAVADQLGQLIVGMREVILPVISHARRDQMLAGGMRIGHTMVDPDVEAAATFGPDVDLLVHVLRADLSSATRVDVDLVDQQDVPRIQLPNVPFDGKTGQVLIACQRHYQHMFPGDPAFVVHAFQGGVRRRIGRYFVRHRWA